MLPYLVWGSRVNVEDTENEIEDIGAVAVSGCHTRWFSAQMLNSRLQHHLEKAKQKMGNQIIPYEAVM
jgi:hypothetical protein